MQNVIALRQLWLFDIFVQCWVIILQICRVSFLCTALCADSDFLKIVFTKTISFFTKSDTASFYISNWRLKLFMLS